MSFLSSISSFILRDTSKIASLYMPLIMRELLDQMGPYKCMHAQSQKGIVCLLTDLENNTVHAFGEITGREEHGELKRKRLQHAPDLLAVFHGIYKLPICMSQKIGREGVCVYMQISIGQLCTFGKRKQKQKIITITARKSAAPQVKQGQVNHARNTACVPCLGRTHQSWFVSTLCSKIDDSTLY